MTSSSDSIELQHAGDSAEREAGGAEADDLPILRVAVAADDVDRIGRRIRVIERAIETLERRAQVTHKSRRHKSQIRNRQFASANHELRKPA